MRFLRAPSLLVDQVNVHCELNQSEILGVGLSLGSAVVESGVWSYVPTVPMVEWKHGSIKTNGREPRIRGFNSYCWMHQC